VEKKFFVRVQTVPGAYTTSYTMGTGSFRGQSGWGVTLTTYLYLATRLKKEYSYNSTPHL
jgi:hypothetical protein